MINRSILERIVAAARLQPGETVLEVGSGLGFLTWFLLQQGVVVHAFEKDEQFVPFLQAFFSGQSTLHLHARDFLKADLDEVLGQTGFKVVANLPYSITAPAMGRILEQPHLDSAVVTVQRQVAERIVSPPARKTYGSFSLFCQFYSRPELLFHISPGNFHPAPAVYSSVVRFTKKAPPLAGREREMFFALVRAVFTTRRKTFLNSLRRSPVPALSQAPLEQLLPDAGIDPGSRGEDLPLEGFIQLAAFLTRHIPNFP